jgi:hypothetical protein
MAKRPLSVLSLVSAMICVGSLLLVGRSFFRSDEVHLPVARDIAYAYVAFTLDGQLVVLQEPGFYMRHYGTERAVDQRRHLDGIWQSITGIRALGVGWGSWGNDWRNLIFPLWLLPIVTAILPVRWWRLRRRRGGRGFPVEVTSSPSPPPPR